MSDDVGSRIRSRRRAQDLTALRLARRLGISRNTVGNWEAGRTQPTAGDLARLAGALSCTVAELLDAGNQDASDEAARQRTSTYCTYCAYCAYRAYCAEVARLQALVAERNALLCQLQQALGLEVGDGDDGDPVAQARALREELDRLRTLAAIRA